MNKPKRKSIEGENHEVFNRHDLNDSYNQACSDWEAFLPSEKDIEKIINEVYKNLGANGVDDSDLAKAIWKRINRTEGGNNGYKDIV